MSYPKEMIFNKREGLSSKQESVELIERLYLYSQSEAERHYEESSKISQDLECMYKHERLHFPSSRHFTVFAKVKRRSYRS